jgi:hypothetical protein
VKHNWQGESVVNPALSHCWQERCEVCGAERFIDKHTGSFEYCWLDTNEQLDPDNCKGRKP